MNMELLKAIYANRNEKNIFEVDLVHVSRSKLTRQMRFFMKAADGTTQHITHDIAELLHVRIKDNSMVVRGVGTDMAFSVLERFLTVVCDVMVEKGLGKRDFGYRCDAASFYKMREA